MKNETLTLGSLFDGSGGFPLGGLLAGIKPVWASEIEPFAVRVTTKRLPEMKHYGDVSVLNGAELPPVDIITFGSPCQDLSVAGKRVGIQDGERSSLFFQAIRIVKEMREATNGEKPRYIVWENVPGAFSSNKGEDFKAVLEAVIGISEPTAAVPYPEKGGWPDADSYMGDGWSVAYRVLDAQWWGVPQRRKRIFLVADFAGRSAEKILFESEGVSGYSAKGIRAWQRTACRAENGAGETGECTGFDGYNGSLTGAVSSTIGENCGMSTGRNGLLVLCDQGGERMDVLEEQTSTLRAEAHHPPLVMEAAGFCTEHSADSRSIGYEEEKSPTLRAGVVPAALALDNHPADSRVKICEDGIVPTLTQRCGTGGNSVPLVMGVPYQEKTGALQASGYAKNGTQEAMNDMYVVETKVYGICATGSNSMKSSNPHSGIYEATTCRTLDLNGGDPSPNQGGMCICEPVACVDQGGGKSNCTVDEKVAPPLACTHGGSPVVAFSQNQREEVRDLGNKAGAIAAEVGIHQQTYVIQGSVIGRENKNGPQGSGVNEDVCFSLNTIDHHAVVVPKDEDKTYAMTTGSYTQVEEEVSPTLMARDYKDPMVINDKAYGFFPQMKAEGMAFAEEVSGAIINGTNPGYQNGVVEPEYIVRRLTPTECARLQGSPDWWCQNLGTENPTEEEIRFWTEVWETHRRLISHADKPKSEKQLLKWLKDPYSDAAEYKLWGNGLCVNIAYFVLSGIVWADGLSIS